MYFVHVHMYYTGHNRTFCNICIIIVDIIMHVHVHIMHVAVQSLVSIDNILFRLQARQLLLMLFKILCSFTCTLWVVLEKPQCQVALTA